jgi:hypothetical protein
VQLLISIATITGDLLALAAAVINLATALAQRHPRTRRQLPRGQNVDKPATG